jgi:hypothetical protein
MHFAMIGFLVSHGCIVYAPDFTDKTCSHFKDYNKTPPEDVYYDNFNEEKHGCDLATFHGNQVTHRMKDIKAVLDYMKSEAKSNVAIDLTKLVNIGHSLGAISAIEACQQFKDDFKLWIGLDPYYYAKWQTLEKIDEGVSQPLLLINSELYHNTFPEIDLKAANQIFFDESCKITKNYNKEVDIPNHFVTTKGTNHQNELDLVLFKSTVLAKVKAVLPTTDHVVKYKEMVNLILAFMSEHGYLPIDTKTRVKDVIISD